jgi:hypothetical protein
MVYQQGETKRVQAHPLLLHCFTWDTEMKQ